MLPRENANNAVVERFFFSKRRCDQKKKTKICQFNLNYNK